MTNKYNAKRTYSTLCARFFPSKWEAERAEQLHLLQLAGEISDLKYQVRFTLSLKPRVATIIDFCYQEDGHIIYEDAKGILTAEARVKYAWLKEKYGIEVKLVRRDSRY